MAIQIITSKRQIRRFLVYDAEWIPGTLQTRIVGVFDGNAYRSYKTFPDFLASELNSKNRGAWFYAHAGGMADVQFVFETLVTDPAYKGYTVKASFSGSSAIIVRISQGKNSWIFVDSYWLLRDKLANIAKMIGMEKTGPSEDCSEEEIAEWYATVPFDELRSYNANDCIVLWRAISTFETALLSLGGQLQMTLASCSMQLFRRKYLRRNIETVDAVNDKVAQAYIASRVEDFRPRATDAYYYDINSSFPYSMTKPAPGELIGVDRSLPAFEGELFFSDVEIEVPDTYLTPAPARLGGRIFFPTGSWRSWFGVSDIEAILREGGKIKKVHQTYHFEPFHDLASFALDLYGRRRDTDDPVEKTVYKLLLNSLYGKFAESEEKTIIHIHPSAKTLSRLSFEDMLFPGAYQEVATVPIPHAWVPISAHITALSRDALFKFLGMTRRFFYCDTDGFATQDRFLTGKELGDLKLEKVQMPWEEWRFLQPKLYRLGDKVKAKGFSLGYDENRPKKKARAIELFESLERGEEITVRRMRRIRQNLAKGSVKPIEETVGKRVRGVLKKRCYDPRTGVSRPWTVDELRRKGLKDG